ncbi:hypothetical protein K493DRAFT_304873 [Basidiobolus meristosporus CBS 931.73]|uniref:Fe2OG dioxygenase domain-containing protein n=1 Tax=Basidiobolus meristosporus CBS 931.73 TaxID=1314790 RepID=A0A1Y1XXJ9_9FUNG|nr:hypothetical protein K493DRAFT_304873 [Basidiobolus meristosporus CBS 931.73]|eukprot:ORX90470.1 hypothetical protein K493DRAFT_304873 [Basidiobolus meristosporus CBS 931.73]
MNISEKRRVSGSNNEVKGDEMKFRDEKRPKVSNISTRSIPLSFKLVRKIKRQGELDLLYFQRLIPEKLATNLFQWCLSELPWYRVQYTVGNRHVLTPRWTTLFGKDFTPHTPTDKVYRRKPQPIPKRLIDLVKLMESYIDQVNNSNEIIIQKNSTPSSSHDIRTMFSRVTSKKTPKPESTADDTSSILQQPLAGPPNSTPQGKAPNKSIDYDRTAFNIVLLNYYETGSDSISYHSDDESFLGVNPTIASFTLGGSRDFLMKHKVNSDLKEKFTFANGDCLVMQGGTQSNWLHAIPKRNTAVQPRINITLRKSISIEGTNNYYKFNVGDGAAYRYRQGKMVPEMS